MNSSLAAASATGGRTLGRGGRLTLDIGKSPSRGLETGRNLHDTKSSGCHSVCRGEEFDYLLGQCSNVSSRIRRRVEFRRSLAVEAHLAERRPLKEFRPKYR